MESVEALECEEPVTDNTLLVLRGPNNTHTCEKTYDKCQRLSFFRGSAFLDTARRPPS